MGKKKFKRNKKGPRGGGQRRVTIISGHDVMGHWGRQAFSEGTNPVQGTNGGILYAGGGQINPPSGTPIPPSSVGSFLPLTATTFGLRSTNFMDQFAMFKVLKMVFKFVPNVKALGDVASNQFTVNVNANTAVTPALRAAVGITYDPCQGPLSYEEVVQSGGKAVEIGARTVTVVGRSGKWCYTTRPSIIWDPSVPNPFTDSAEVRQLAPGQLNFVWYTASTTTDVGTATLFNDMGVIECDWTFAFKDPIDPDLNLSLRGSSSLATTIIASLRRSKKTDESKDSGSPVIVREPDEDKEEELVQAIKTRAAYRSVITRLGLEALELKDAPKPHKA